MSVTRPTLIFLPPLVVVGVEAEVPPLFEAVPPQPPATRASTRRTSAGPRLIDPILPLFPKVQSGRSRRDRQVARRDAREPREEEPGEHGTARVAGGARDRRSRTAEARHE